MNKITASFVIAINFQEDTTPTRPIMGILFRQQGLKACLIKGRLSDELAAQIYAQLKSAQKNSDHRLSELRIARTLVLPSLSMN
jgi:hypothetical protein